MSLARQHVLSRIRSRRINHSKRMKAVMIRELRRMPRTRKAIMEKRAEIAWRRTTRRTFYQLPPSERAKLLERMLEEFFELMEAGVI